MSNILLSVNYNLACRISLFPPWKQQRHPFNFHLLLQFKLSGYILKIIFVFSIPNMPYPCVVKYKMMARWYHWKILNGNRRRKMVDKTCHHLSTEPFCIQSLHPEILPTFSSRVYLWWVSLTLSYPHLLSILPDLDQIAHPITWSSFATPACATIYH